MSLEEFVWRCASSASPSATWAFLFNFPCPVGQCDQGSSRKMWVSSRALKIFLFTFLDWPDFHFAEYLFLSWMPFKKLWDMDSNYFFCADDDAKGFRSSISSAAKRGQNRHGHPAQHQDAVRTWIRRFCNKDYESGVIVFCTTSSLRMCMFQIFASKSVLFRIWTKSITLN